MPLLVETGPGNILNVTLYIFIWLSLALCGRCAQQEARDHQFGKKWKNMLFICSTFPPECEATKRMTNVRVDGGEWSTGAAQIGGGTEREGELGGRKKKSDGTCSFIRSFTPVATATCLEGTQERRHHWQKQQRGREWVRANESKRDRLCVWMRAERGESMAADLQPTTSLLKEVWIWPSGTRQRSVMSVHSSLEVIQINVWIALLKFHQQRLRSRLWVWISLISPLKKDTIMRYEIGRVNQTEANA